MPEQNSGRKKSELVVVWYCCSCRIQGGMTIAIAQCPEVRCQHRRCQYCTVDRMESSRVHFKQYAFVWRSEFNQQRTAIYPVESIRHVERVPPIRDSSISTSDLIDRFVENQCYDDPDRYLYRNPQLTQFLKLANMDSLRGPVSPSVSIPKILLDDRNNSSVTRSDLGGTRRQLPGTSLNAHQLYAQLLLPRTTWPVMTPGHVDVERRLIYITDLDPFCVLALAATVSPNQSVALRDFVYRYLSFRALIGAEIPAIKTTVFSFQFHLPYYAWRKERFVEPATDNIRPIRRSEEVIHLRIPGHSNHIDHEKDYIHEAQSSVMVIGLDNWFWTAYCFVDVSFKGIDHNERPDDYNNPDQPLDPHSCGKYPADRPIWDPRHYFLQSLTCRMQQVKQEWNNVIFQLFKETEPCIYLFTRGESILGDTAALEITQQPGFKWTIRVLRQFTHLLSKTINSWDTFKDGEIRYFNHPDTDSLADPSWGTYLAAIDKDVVELRDLRSSLENQTELFENMTNTLVTHAALAEARLTRTQSEFVQVLTVITILYLPASLAAAIYSMPILQSPNLKQFSFTFSILLVVTLLLGFNLHHFIKWIEPLRDWQDRHLQHIFRRKLMTRRVRARHQESNDDEIFPDGISLQQLGG